MTTTSQRNKKCQLHGEQGEQTALDYLRARAPGVKVEMINGLLDIVVRNTFVEVKSCSERVVNGVDLKPRYGRFTFLPQQHEELRLTDGYYLFVVLSGPEDYTGDPYLPRDDDHPGLRHLSKPVHIFMIAARELPYYRQMSWTTVIKYEHSFPFGKLVVTDRSEHV